MSTTQVKVIRAQLEHTLHQRTYVQLRNVLLVPLENIVQIVRQRHQWTVIQELIVPLESPNRKHVPTRIVLWNVPKELIVNQARLLRNHVMKVHTHKTRVLKDPVIVSHVSQDSSVRVNCHTRMIQRLCTTE